MAYQAPTVDALRAKGFVKEGDTIARTRLADHVNGELIASAVVTSEAKIDTDGRFALELMHTIFGTVDPVAGVQLSDLISQLTGPGGTCQQRLDAIDTDDENGAFVLCSKRVTRTFSNGNGTAIELTRPARFLTREPELIERYNWVATSDRIASGMASLGRRFELTIKRVPALAQRKQEMIDRTYAKLEEEVPRIEAPKDEEPKDETS
jgi:hypothetical protein